MFQAVDVVSANALGGLRLSLMFRDCASPDNQKYRLSLSIKRSTGLHICSDLANFISMATTVGGEFKVHGLVSLEATKSHHPELREKEASIQTTEQQGSQFEPHTSMQATFDKIVCHELGTPFRYRKVAVLIVHWAEYLDRDLQCGREVSNYCSMEYWQ